MRTKIGFALMMWAVVSFSAQAQEQITIRVLDSWTGSAVPDATVRMRDAEREVASGLTDANGEVTLSTDMWTAVRSDLPRRDAIDGPFPLPARDRVSVRVRLSEAGDLEVRIFDLLGREVLRESRRASAGTLVVDLDLSGMPAGAYIFSLRSRHDRLAIDRVIQRVGGAGGGVPSLSFRDEGEAGASSKVDGEEAAWYRLQVEKSSYAAERFGVTLPAAARLDLYLAIDPASVSMGGVIVARAERVDVPVLALYQDSTVIGGFADPASGAMVGVGAATPEGAVLAVRSGDDGLPVRGMLDDWLYLFGNYGSGRLDLAVIDPAGSVTVVRGVAVDAVAGSREVFTGIGLGSWIASATGLVRIAACAIEGAHRTGLIPDLAYSSLGCGGAAYAALEATRGVGDEGLEFGSPAFGAFARLLECVDSADNPTPGPVCVGEVANAARELWGSLDAAFLDQAAAVEEAESRLSGSFVNSMGMEFVRVAAGAFTMGSSIGNPDELPVHEVSISRDFWIGSTEVTQAQWVAVMGSNPSFFSSCGETCPIEVSWESAQEFVRVLNTLEGTTTYRLPTEAEWEYAARAGTATAYWYGDDSAVLPDYAWYITNSGGSPHPVGQKAPNAWGLFDVAGNMWEWTNDRYADSYGSSLPADPTGPASGADRVIRGGSWSFNAYHQRSAIRGHRAPDETDLSVGFRVVRSDLRVNAIGMQFAPIRAGSFTMGTNAGDPDEFPEHPVTLTKDYLMGVHEVTQGQWIAVMESDPSFYPECGETCPVESITWESVQLFVQKLNEIEHTDVYRLPTEAEWEYAARAGTTTVYWYGDDPALLDGYAWYSLDAQGHKHPVGGKIANPWGLHDVQGNVWEWVQDWFGAFSADAQVDPIGPPAGSERVIRGGSWSTGILGVRTASRTSARPDAGGRAIGVRIARSVE